MRSDTLTTTAVATSRLTQLLALASLVLVMQVTVPALGAIELRAHPDDAPITAFTKDVSDPALRIRVQAVDNVTGVVAPLSLAITVGTRHGDFRVTVSMVAGVATLAGPALRVCTSSDGSGGSARPRYAQFYFAAAANSELAGAVWWSPRYAVVGSATAPSLRLVFAPTSRPFDVSSGGGAVQYAAVGGAAMGPVRLLLVDTCGAVVREAPLAGTNVSFALLAVRTGSNGGTALSAVADGLRWDAASAALALLSPAAASGACAFRVEARDAHGRTARSAPIVVVNSPAAAGSAAPLPGFLVAAASPVEIRTGAAFSLTVTLGGLAAPDAASGLLALLEANVASWAPVEATFRASGEATFVVESASPNAKLCLAEDGVVFTVSLREATRVSVAPLRIPVVVRPGSASRLAVLVDGSPLSLVSSFRVVAHTPLPDVTVEAHDACGRLDSEAFQSAPLVAAAAAGATFGAATPAPTATLVAGAAMFPRLVVAPIFEASPRLVFSVGSLSVTVSLSFVPATPGTILRLRLAPWEGAADASVGHVPQPLLRSSAAPDAAAAAATGPVLVVQAVGASGGVVPRVPLLVSTALELRTFGASDVCAFPVGMATPADAAGIAFVSVSVDRCPPRHARFGFGLSANRSWHVSTDVIGHHRIVNPASSAPTRLLAVNAQSPLGSDSSAGVVFPPFNATSLHPLVVAFSNECIDASPADVTAASTMSLFVVARGDGARRLVATAAVDGNVAVFCPAATASVAVADTASLVVEAPATASVTPAPLVLALRAAAATPPAAVYAASMTVSGDFASQLADPVHRAALTAAIDADLERVVSLPVTITEMLAGSLVVRFEIQSAAPGNQAVASAFQQALASPSFLANTQQTFTANGGTGSVAVQSIVPAATSAPTLKPSSSYRSFLSASVSIPVVVLLILL